jgi:hypothetical protein
LRSFPYGRFDDQVDASSRAFMTLLETRLPMRISQTAVDRAHVHLHIETLEAFEQAAQDSTP